MPSQLSQWAGSPALRGYMTAQSEKDEQLAKSFGAPHGRRATHSRDGDETPQAYPDLHTQPVIRKASRTPPPEPFCAALVSSEDLRGEAV